MNNIIEKPKHGFNIKEFELRMSEAHQMMSKNKLDAFFFKRFKCVLLTFDRFIFSDTTGNF